MALYQDAVVAATAVVGYDLAAGKEYQQSSRPRVLRRFGLTGSAAIDDTIVEILAGTRLLARFRNSQVIARPLMHSDMFEVNEVIPQGVNLMIRVTDAPVTNAIGWALEVSS